MDGMNGGRDYDEYGDDDDGRGRGRGGDDSDWSDDSDDDDDLRFLQRGGGGGRGDGGRDDDDMDDWSDDEDDDDDDGRGGSRDFDDYGFDSVSKVRTYFTFALIVNIFVAAVFLPRLRHAVKSSCCCYPNQSTDGLR